SAGADTGAEGPRGRRAPGRSGGLYATPVVAVPVEGGYVVPLPCGTDVDWCRNALAAGGAIIEVHGAAVAVAEPEVVDAAAALPLLPRERRLVYRRFRISRYLRLRMADRVRRACRDGSGA